MKIIKKVQVILLILTIICTSFISCGKKEAVKESAEKSDDIIILYTNDVHCGISEKLGYAKLKQYKNQMEKNINMLH